MGDRGGQWPDVAEHVPEAMGDRGAARISVAEMKSYYIYCEWCSWLLSVAEGESSGPLGSLPAGVWGWGRDPTLQPVVVQAETDGQIPGVLVGRVQSASPWHLERLRDGTVTSLWLKVSALLV